MMTTSDRIAAGMCSLLLVVVSTCITLIFHDDYRILSLLLGSFLAGSFMMCVFWPKGEKVTYKKSWPDKEKGEG